MSLDLALSIARSGLSNVNRQLAQSAANVSNAATPGYTRKVVQSQAIVAGTNASGVRSLEAAREVDTALVTQMNAARASTAASTARTQILQGVEIAHGTSGDSVADLTGALGDAFVTLREDPSDALLQSGVTSAASALAGRYNTVSDAILTARQSSQDAMVADVKTLNDGLKNVSKLSDRIQELRAQGLSTADLEDQRDQAVATMSSVMQMRALPQADGGVVLITAGGLSLPLHQETGPFSMEAATLGAESYHGAGGTLPGVMLSGSDVTNRLGNGTLAAYASLRDTELPRQQAELDVSAASLSSRFDAQGLTLFTGDTGTVPNPTTPYKTGGWLGFAGSIRVNPALLDSTSGVRDGTRAVAAGEGGATAFTPNASTGPASFTTLIDRVLNQTFGTEVSKGNPQPSFATTGLGPDGSLTSSLRSSRSLGDYATQLVATQTGARAESEAAGKTSGDLLTSLETRFSQRSGVDMDKELAAMVTLQTAYAANARLISAVQTMYDSLFQAVR